MALRHLVVLLVATLALVSAVPVPEPSFWKSSHEHHVIHVPYHVHHVHHYHKVPIYVKSKPIIIKSHEHGDGWDSGWSSGSSYASGWD